MLNFAFFSVMLSKDTFLVEPLPWKGGLPQESSWVSSSKMRPVYTLLSRSLLSLQKPQNWNQRMRSTIEPETDTDHHWSRLQIWLSLVQTSHENKEMKQRIVEP
jgi:hypothetical protein